MSDPNPYRPPSADAAPPAADAPPAAATPPAAARRDPYAAWRLPNYRLYVAAWFSMTFGYQVLTVAVGLKLYNQTGSALDLGLVGLVQALPVLLLAIPGGQIADRFSRKWVVVVMLAVSVVVSAGLLVAARVDASPAWLYFLLTVGAVGQSLGGPSRAALLPQIVPGEMFNSAVTWNTSVFHVASMSGPAVGGLLMSLDKSATTAFAAVMLCRLLAMGAMLGVRHQGPGRPTESVSLATLMAGIRFVARNRPILAAITLDLFAVLLGGLTYLLPVFAKDVLRLPHPEDAVGFLRSMEAVGAVCMAVLLAHRPPLRRAGRTMLWAVALFGGATIVFGFSPWYGLSLAMMFLIGAFDNISVVVRHTLVQMLTPDTMRGRVSAVNNIFITASNDLGGLESGLTAWAFGPVISVVGGGIGTILVVLAAAWLWPQLPAIGSLSDLKPEEAAEPPP